jgi:hypothetical protein
MAKAILVIGDMGTGKSTALRNLSPDETVIIMPNTKDLPWEGGMADYSYAKGNLVSCLKIRKKVAQDPKEPNGVLEHLGAANLNPKIKTVVLEDITHFMNDRMMDDAFTANQDWGKWNKFGADMFAITTKHIQQMRDDLTVIIIGHTEIKDNGAMGLQTAGKLLDNTIKLPSYFTYIFHSRVFTANNALSYKFQTHNDGKHLAKTPMNMFKEDFVDNDLRQIIARIDEYRAGIKPSVPVVDPGPVKLT